MIQKEIKNILSEAILFGDLSKGGVAHFSCVKEKLTYKFVSKKLESKKQSNQQSNTKAKKAKDA